ncbi:MAG TPA: hypothetical protein VFU21_26440 [Kofleriaceae bacterium]|nr:hypothetical protein [Kofleriaceae bacterium]
MFTASAASGLLLGLVLSLCACPRPIENPADPDQPVAGEPDKGDVIEPGRPAPGDAGPPPPIEPLPTDPDPPEVPSGREQPAVNPVAPPMDPKNAPLRV